MSELQNRIIELLSKDLSHFTCDDIAWELKIHKMHVGNSIKSLVKKVIPNVFTNGIEGVVVHPLIINPLKDLSL